MEQHKLNFESKELALEDREMDYSRWRDDSVSRQMFSTNLIATHYDSTKKMLAKYNLGPGVVTNTGVIFMAQSFTGQMSISAFNYHDSGTGSTAAAVGDIGLSTTAGIPGRGTGVQTCPTTGQYKTVGTQTYTGAVGVQEWGLFNQAATGAGSVMWDRKTFAVINVANGDSIQFSYVLTITPGG